jgi:TonB family protein
MKVDARFTLCLLLPLAVRAQTAPDAPALDAIGLLERADAPIFIANTVRLTGAHQTTLATGVRTSTSFSFERRSDGKVREELNFAGAGGSALRLFDGTAAWDYRAATNTYTRIPPQTRVAYPEFTNLEYGRNAVNIMSARIDGQENLAIDGKMVACDIVVSSYKGYATNALGKNVVRRVLISRDQRLILRDEWTLEVSSGIEQHVVTYARTEWDIALADDRFVFQPPPGSKLSQPAAAAATKAPARVEPVLVGKIEPEYTEEARAAGLQGTVSLFVWVNPDGSSELSLLHGLGMGLDEKAMEAVQRLHFTPGKIDGQPSRMGHSIDIDFRLEQPAPWRVRLAAYSVKVERGDALQTLAKPVLTRYTAPEAVACPADGGSTLIKAKVGTNGRAESVQPENSGDPVGAAAAKAVEAWLFRPGAVNGKRRETAASIEFECGPPRVFPNAANAPGQKVTNPEPMYRPEPAYSEPARRAKLSGSVLLALVIDQTGHAKDIRVLKPLGLGLDEKAVEAVKTWRFKPGTKGDQPVAVAAQIEVTFRLL